LSYSRTVLTTQISAVGVEVKVRPVVLVRRERNRCRVV